MSLDNLTLYGKSFQTKVITALLTDVKFLAQVFDIIDPKQFDSDAANTVIDAIKVYYTTYKNPPTAEYFKKIMEEQKNDLDKISIGNQLAECAKHSASTDMQYVKDEFINFCINQNLKNAIMTSIDYMNQGKYENIRTVVDNALKAGQSRDLGHIYETQIEERIMKNSRKKLVPTEWPVINDIIDGGLGSGDLGVLVGGAGMGKSWVLTSLGYNALKMGKNVVHFTLELNENYTAKRYDTKLTGIPSENLKFHLDELKDKIENTFTGKLIVKYYPTKSVSLSTIRAQLDLIKQHSFEPDLVIIDYADLLKVEDVYNLKGGSYSEMGSIYESLRGLAGEYDVPVWTASQAHRSAEDEEVITGAHVAESYKKVMVADFIVSISRRMEDKAGGVARLYVIKNRYGKDGLTFPSKVDLSVGQISIERPDTYEGAKIKQIMKGGETFRKNKLAERRTDMKNEDKFKTGAKKIDLGGFESTPPNPPQPPTENSDEAV